MKMSLCNTFRFVGVFATIVMSILGSPVPQVMNLKANITAGEINQDLQHQGSITVELKRDIKRPNDINSLNLNNNKVDSNTIPLDAEGIKKNVNKNQYVTTVSTVVASVTSFKNVQNATETPIEIVTEEIHTPTALYNKTSNDSKLLETTENKNLMKQGIKTQNNDTINRIETEVITTTIQLEAFTEITLLDIKEESTNITQLHTEKNILNANDTRPTQSAKSAELSLSTNPVAKPTRKKYSVIERKRVSTTTSEPITPTDTSTDNTEIMYSTTSEEPTTVTEKSEVMVKSESAQGRISLQDAITSDIPSLEKLKSDLLSFPKFTSKIDTESTTHLLSPEESVTKTDVSTFITTNFPSTFNSESPNTVSSKRAGYLDLSVKNASAEDDISLKPNGTEMLQGPFDAETPDIQDESADDKIERRVESQSQLAEDAIKEELLKEEMLNDNEEISKLHRDEGKQIKTDTPVLPITDNGNITQFDDKLAQSAHSAVDDNLSVRPINPDKAKNTVLYPVNPNYKPLKKIEVQPAKPFVRDPDDNSWRNESLSSLGIVFKPKNSSKPFTQVLKNKTETEWNNLPEKDMKSEVPDLRVRLEQIAQKRKSKKKKIDSFGNIYYTDYEENSSSEENLSTPQVEDPTLGTVSTTDVSTSGITIVTPIQTTSLLTSTTTTASASGANDVPALTTTPTPREKIETTSKKQPSKFTTLRPPKMFNLFDYYETNDDEDITDYLNMAKIDLKKFTVPIHTTYTPYTSPPLPVLYTNPMTQYTQERKGTIQYFPPRSTKRPRKNKNNNIREKINTFTDSPKHVLPISYHKLTTPFDSNIYFTNGPDMTRLKDDLADKTFDRDLYLTTPALTTLPDEDFGIIGNEQGYNRPNYVIKHYKDYMNIANQEQEHNKHREYAFTEPPVRDITMTDLIKPTTIREKTTVTEDYDYESQFRKDLLDRFVANYNEKSNRFKSDFPVVYNNSIIHGHGYDEKDVAMSRAYFRRPYSNQDYKPIVRDPYDPNCENVTVELSPAYELHYYVPEQEEKQEVESKPINLPVRYRL